MNPNQIIQNYKLVRKLGEGGMGEVWLAEHEHMDRKAAIKFLHPHLARHEEIRKRFKKEAGVLSRLDHPNIVRMYDLVVTDQDLYMIMEYVDGVNLEDMIRKQTGPMREEHIRELFKQMAAAIDYAHGIGVIHRDIKPGNFIVTKDNTVKVLDFGIAKVLHEDNTLLTQTGQWVGTPTYMSPEQIKGEKIDHRTDIYSLGLTLYMMATGKGPYVNITNPTQLILEIATKELPSPRSAYPGISSQMEQVILKATSKDVKNRFGKCGEIFGISTNTNQTAKVLSNKSENRSFRFKGEKIEMIFVDGGTGSIGCTLHQDNQCKPEEGPEHQRLFEKFFLGETPVSVALWNLVFSSESDYSKVNAEMHASFPITNISWRDAKYFISRLNELTKENFRLPSEFEWEYAARGGIHNSDFQFAGSNSLTKVGWYKENSSQRIMPMKSKAPNALGLYDMSGGVWEWCSNLYKSNYEPESKLILLGRSLLSTNRAVRGGSWYSKEEDCRVCSRYFHPESDKNPNVGFRLALSY